MKVESVNLPFEGYSTLHLVDGDGQRYIVNGPRAFIAQFAAAEHVSLDVRQCEAPPK